MVVPRTQPGLRKRSCQGVLTVTTASSKLVKSISHDGRTPRPSASEGAGIKSVRRIRALADRVLMCHDPQIGMFQEGGFPLTSAVVDAETATERAQGETHREVQR